MHAHYLKGEVEKVVDAAGTLLFEIDGKLKTISDRLSDRHIVKDAKGTEIGQVRRKRTPNIHNTTYLGTMSDERKIIVRSKGSTNAARAMDATEFAANIHIGDAVSNKHTFVV